MSNKVISFGVCLLLLFCQAEFGQALRVSRRHQENREYDFSNGKLNPIVTTNSGKLEGYVIKSVSGRGIYAFEGIPYAETTGGRNRFEIAIPKAPWSGIRPAKAPGSFCLQLIPFRLYQIIGSEDCLFLNIYVPSEPILRGNASLPVIVFIHGGSWYYGAGSDVGPYYLLEHDVILVTLNYRLGIFGFMSTGDEHMPGNYGQKDQRSALKWVKENIGNFGGDPSRVTLAGHSSGGASVHFHMLAKSSHQYFSSAISMSGNAFVPWTLMTKRHIEAKKRKISAATKCPLGNSREFADCLRNVDGRELLRSFQSLFELVVLPTAPLSIAIEDDLPGAHITAHPDEIYARNAVAKVPYICSTTTEEITLTLPGVRAVEAIYNRISPRSRTFKRAFRGLAPLLLEYQHIPVTGNLNSIADNIFDFYLRNGRPNKTNFTAIGELASDRYFGYGTHKTWQIHSQVAPTYGYVYGYHSRSNTVARLTRSDPRNVGVSHNDDLVCVLNVTWGRTTLPLYKVTDPDYSVVKLLTSVWYNFAAKRKPLSVDQDGIEQTIWNPVKDPFNVQILQINNQGVKMVPEPNKERLKFWETLGLSDTIPYATIRHNKVQ